MRRTIICSCIVVCLLIFVIYEFSNGDDDIDKDALNDTLNKLDTKDDATIKKCYKNLDEIYKNNENKIGNANIMQINDVITPQMYAGYYIFIKGLYEFNGKFNDNISRNIRKYLNARAPEKIGQKPKRNASFFVAEEFLPEYLQKQSSVYVIRKAVLSHPEMLYNPNKDVIGQLNNACIADLHSADVEEREAAVYILTRNMGNIPVIESLSIYIKSETDNSILQDLLMYLSGLDSSNEMMLYGFLNRARELKIKLDPDRMIGLMFKREWLKKYPSIFKDLLYELIQINGDPSHPYYANPMERGNTNMLNRMLLLFSGVAINYRNIEQWKEWWEKNKNKSNEEIREIVFKENIDIINRNLKNNPDMMYSCTTNIQANSYIFSDKMFSWIKDQIEGAPYTSKEPYNTMFEGILTIAGAQDNDAINYLCEMIINYKTDNESECSPQEISLVTRTMDTFMKNKIYNKEGKMKILEKYYGRNNNFYIISSVANVLFEDINYEESSIFYLKLLDKSQSANDLYYAVTEILGMKEYKDHFENNRNIQDKYNILFQHSNAVEINNEVMMQDKNWWKQTLTEAYKEIKKGK